MGPRSGRVHPGVSDLDEKVAKTRPRSATIEPARLAGEIAARLRALPRANVPAVRALRREYSKRLAEQPGQDLKALALALLRERSRGTRLMASELLVHHPDALAEIRTADLERLGAGMESWDAVDIFCLVSGRAWRQRQVPDSVIHRWARRDNRWWRRTALVSTVPLNTRAQGGTGDPRRTLAVCRLLIDDRDDMVVKAMSWALRALALHEPGTVAKFLAQYRTRLAARVIREVSNKLRTGLKNPKTR